MLLLNLGSNLTEELKKVFWTRVRIIWNGVRMKLIATCSTFLLLASCQSIRNRAAGAQVGIPEKRNASDVSYPLGTPCGQIGTSLNVAADIGLENHHRIGARVQGPLGNQMLQYAFVNLYGKRHNLSIEFPMWIGDSLFLPTAKEPRGDLPEINESSELYKSFSQTTLKRFQDATLVGYFQYSSKEYGEDKQCFQKLFEPRREHMGALNEALGKLKARGETLVAFHIQETSGIDNSLIRADTQWYVDWLQANWEKLHKPVLYISSNDLSRVLPAFAKFSPETDDSLKLTFTPFQEFLGMYILANAKVVGVTKNSSYSMMAALLNKEPKAQFLIPAFQDGQPLGKLTAFDPWDIDLFDPNLRGH